MKCKRYCVWLRYIMLILLAMLFVTKDATPTYAMNVKSEVDADRTMLSEGEYLYEVLEDGTVEITGYTGTDAHIDIPETIAGKTVTSISAYAFDDCEIDTVAIPKCVVNIASTAFDKTMATIHCYENSAAHTFAKNSWYHPYRFIYHITATAEGEGGTLTPIGEQRIVGEKHDVEYNSAVSGGVIPEVIRFEYQAELGYEVAEVKVDGVSIETDIHNYSFYNVSENHTIEVSFRKVKVNAINLSETTLKMKKGESITLDVNVQPSNTLDRSVTWTSSNENVATVEAPQRWLATVTAKNPGTAILTATANDGSGVTATCTVVVKEEIKYNIAFDSNGATSGKMAAMKNCVSDKDYKLSANAFKKTGYTFAGWNTKANGKGTAYTDKASIKDLSSENGKTVTLYAQWKKTKYNITYKLNGGKNSKSNKSSYYVDTATFKLKNPTKKGYTFKGWYSDKKCTKKVTKITKGTTGNKTLYAKWTKTKYKITYVLNKGKNNKSNKATYDVTTKTFKLKNPTRKGYVFKGWYSDKKCTKKVTKITKGSTGNMKLYAKWVKKK